MGNKQCKRKVPEAKSSGWFSRCMRHGRGKQRQLHEDSLEAGIEYGNMKENTPTRQERTKKSLRQVEEGSQEAGTKLEYYNMKDRTGQESKKKIRRHLNEDLHEAAKNGYFMQIKENIDQGANVNNKDEMGSTPIHVAAYGGHDNCIQLLLELGAKPNVRANDGFTPLHWASRWGKKKCVITLLKGGSDPSIRTNSGYIPLHQCVDKHLDITEILIKATATAKQMWAINMMAKAKGGNDHSIYRTAEILLHEYYAERDGQKIEDNDVLDLSYCNLNDTDFEKQLNELNKDKRYKVLNVSSNNLTHLPNLRKFPHFNELQYLDISFNKIHTLEGLPTSDKLCMIWLDGNPIETLQHDCFCQETFTLLKQKVRLNDLIQPPAEVINRGLKEVLTYFTQGDLLLKSGLRLVNIGNTCAGKTSLIETLISGEPYLTAEADRTRVVDVKFWEPNETDTFVIYDQGGHMIYDITNPFFISRRCTVLITHDISVCNTMDRTLSAFRRTLHQFPDNEIHFILSKIDALDEENLNERVHLFITDINNLLNCEIDTCERLLNSPRQGQIEVIQVESFIDSCKTKRNNIRYFPISSKTYAGILTLRDFLVNNMKKQRVVIPMAWVNCYSALNSKECNFWMIEDLKFCILDRLNVLHFSDEIYHSCLDYLNDVGLIVRFVDNNILKKYIFHNPEFLIKIMQALFSHDLRCQLDYHTKRELQYIFEEPELDEAISMYEQEGLLLHKLLVYLWRQYKLSVQDTTALILLIKAFHFFSEVNKEDDINDTIYFVPWLVQHNKVPGDLNINQPVVMSEELVSLNMQTVFHNKIPVNVTEMCLVELQKFAVTEGYMGVRYSWQDGLQIKLGQTEINAFRNNENSSIILCTKAHYLYLTDIWESLHRLHKSLQYILRSWHGAIKSQHSVCGHCVIENIQPPHLWLPKKVFPQAEYSLSYVNCKKNKAAVPAGLVTMMRQTDTNHSIENVKQFLKEKFATKENYAEMKPKVLVESSEDLVSQISSNPEQTSQHQAILESPDASVLQLKCEHPVLASTQEILEEYLNPNEMIDKLIKFDVIRSKNTITSDRSVEGRVKKILVIVDKNKKIAEFIQALNDCKEIGANYNLAAFVRDKHKEFLNSQL